MVLGRDHGNVGADSIRCTEFAQTPEEQKHIWELLKYGSFNMWRKAIVLIIGMLDCSKIDIEISDSSIKTVEFSKYREMLEYDEVTNGVSAIIYSRT